MMGVFGQLVLELFKSIYVRDHSVKISSLTPRHVKGDSLVNFNLGRKILSPPFVREVNERQTEPE